MARALLGAPVLDLVTETLLTVPSREFVLSHAPRRRRSSCECDQGRITDARERPLGPQAKHPAQADDLLGIHAVLEGAAAFVGDEAIPPSSPAAAGRLISDGGRGSCGHE